MAKTTIATATDFSPAFASALVIVANKVFDIRTTTLPLVQQQRKLRQQQQLHVQVQQKLALYAVAGLIILVIAFILWNLRQARKGVAWILDLLENEKK